MQFTWEIRVSRQPGMAALLSVSWAEMWSQTHSILIKSQTPLMGKASPFRLIYNDFFLPKKIPSPKAWSI